VVERQQERNDSRVINIKVNLLRGLNANTVRKRAKQQGRGWKRGGRGWNGRTRGCAERSGAVTVGKAPLIDPFVGALKRKTKTTQKENVTYYELDRICL